MSDALQRMLGLARGRAVAQGQNVADAREMLALAQKQGMKALEVSLRSRLLRMEKVLAATHAEIGELEKLTGALPLQGGAGKR